MAIVYWPGTTGAKLYAKPLDLTTVPAWATDAIDFTESPIAVVAGGRNTFKSNSSLDPTKSYQMFVQLGAQKASNDKRIGTIGTDDLPAAKQAILDSIASARAAILDAIAAARQAAQDDWQDIRGLVETVNQSMATEAGATQNQQALATLIAALASEANATANLETLQQLITSGAIDINLLAATVVQKILGSSIARNKLPIVGDGFTAIYNADFVTDIPIVTAADDDLFLTIGCKTVAMRATSEDGLTHLAGEVAAESDAASIERVDGTKVKVTIRGRALKEIYKSDSRVYQLEIRTVDAPDTIPLFSSDLVLIYSVGTDVAA